MLAGVNLLVAQQRGDSTDAIRQLAYIGSNIDNLLSLAAAGKLYAPGDVANVQNAVASSLSSYGVAQTLLNIFDGVGLTLFVAGKDDTSGFTSPANIAGATGAVITKILSAVDPQSATLDPHLLVASINTSSSPSVGGKQYLPTSLESFQVINAPPTPSLDSIVGTTTIDLTTYAGITSLMEIIRTIYDFYPGALS